MVLLRERLHLLKLLALGGLAVAGILLALKFAASGDSERRRPSAAKPLPPGAGPEGSARHAGPPASLSDDSGSTAPGTRPDDRPRLPGVEDDHWLTDEQKELQQQALRLAKTKGIPVSLEEAVKLSPALDASFARYHPNYRENFDYKLKVFARLRVCLGDRVKSLGYMHGLLIFELRETRLVGNGFDVRHSTLTPEEDQIILACLGSVHDGFVFTGDFVGDRRYIGIKISFPLTRASPYRAIEAGDYGVPIIDDDGNLIP